MTPFEAIGIALAGKDRHTPLLSWLSMDAHDESAYAELGKIADDLGRTFCAIEHHPALEAIDVREWSSTWQERLLTAAEALHQASVHLQQILSSFSGRLGLSERNDTDFAGLEATAAAADAILPAAGQDFTIIFDSEFSKLGEELSKLGSDIQAYRSKEAELSAAYERDEALRIPVDDLDQQWRAANAAFWPFAILRKRKICKLLQSYAREGRANPAKDLPLLRAMQVRYGSISGSRLASMWLFRGLETDTGQFQQHLEIAGILRAALMRLSPYASSVQDIATAVAPALRNEEGLNSLHEAARHYIAAQNSFAHAAHGLEELAGKSPLDPESGTVLSDIASQMADFPEVRPYLRDWSSWCSIRERARSHGLAALVTDLEMGAFEPDETAEVFRLAYCRWWLPLVLDSEPVLRNFRRFQHEHAAEDFRALDDIVRKHATARVLDAIAHDLLPSQSVPRKSELGLLRHQMELQRPSRAIREMIGAMPSTFSKLAPCVLMSPLSIAQYLPPDQALFDVVIFDEASQITTWDAVGAIARGRQTIIVGDPKQLPPTNFFGRNEDEGEEVEEFERDLESILDEAKASGLPVRDLRWHYRSRHESLIAFSNHHYYGNRLITFPSPVTEDRAVSLWHIKDGVYDRGKSRTNREEARAVSREVATRLRAWLKLPESKRPTIGVITFNSQQQSLIQDFLDEVRRDEPTLEWFFSEDRIEPVIVKNLENVQGDERDVMLFSITFCKDAAGRPSMDFGAINREGGERRLNVAVTRARQELLVFSGLTADQIDLARTKAKGVSDLRTFLDYAERGPAALPARDAGSQGSYESPFETALAEELQRRGWNVVPQVGVSGFRIDIDVKHPDKPGAYLAGIECDGATYQQSATARDRDNVREQVLRGLGWEILRVWSTDWWFDQTGAADRLHEALEILLVTSRSKAPDEQPAHWDMGQTETFSEKDDPSAPGLESEQTEYVSDHVAAEPAQEAPEAERLVGGREFRLASTIQLSAGQPSASYRATDLSTFAVDPGAFQEFSYQPTLAAMVNAILETEAPVREDVLYQRIARAHGWLRTGGRIKERISLHLRDADRTEESSGAFIWKKGTIEERLRYRAPASPKDGRSIGEIPMAELVDMTLRNPLVLDESDPALILARLLKVDRLTATSRARLEEAIRRALNHRKAAEGART